LEALLSQKTIYHAIMAVENMDGSFRWSSAAGIAHPNGTPVQPDTPFFIASIDKLYTAVVIMKLFEENRIALDQPVADFLPSSLVTGLHQLEGVDYTKQITIRHLLSHTSGLADYLEDRPKPSGSRSIIEMLVEDDDRSWNIEDFLARVRGELTPHFPPQSLNTSRQKVRYSDTNYLLLIAIIEAVYNKPLHEVFAELLFLPLQMRHTFFLGQSEPLQPLPHPPAALWFADQALDLPQAFASLKSIYSTTADQILSLRAIMNGSVFKRPETLGLMQQRWNRFGLPFDQAAMRAPSWPIEYGLGIKRFQMPRLFTLGRRVPAVIGHTGSTGSWLFYCPERGLLLSGTVDQATAGAVPFRFIPKLLQSLETIS
jgi:CubicO group peptidase (beta-lactamase class C family)